MISSKSNKLKIKFISKFKPLELLQSIVEIYGILNTNQKFIEEVVKNERSFHIQNFEKVWSLVEWRMKLNIEGDIYDKYLITLWKLREVEEEAHIKAKMLEDCPEKFIDELF